jgi:transcriptional regulator with XRE-family HTH domain
MEPKSAAGRASLDEVVGERVHMLMWKAKITQTAMARQMGVDQSALSKRIRGERGWSLDDVEAAASILGVSVANLLDRNWYTPRDSNPEPADIGSAVVRSIDSAPSIARRFVPNPNGGEAA